MTGRNYGRGVNRTERSGMKSGSVPCLPATTLAFHHFIPTTCPASPASPVAAFSPKTPRASCDRSGLTPNPHR